MVNYRNFSFGLGLILLANIFSISAISNYKAMPLASLLAQVVDEDDQSISFDYLVYNTSDCKRYLGRYKIISRGYQPIQITISNNTDKYLKLDLSSFDIPCTSAEEVAYDVEFNTASRIVGWS